MKLLGIHSKSPGIALVPLKHLQRVTILQLVVALLGTIQIDSDMNFHVH